MTRRNGYSAGYYRAHVKPPNTPPKQPHCGACWKTDAWRAQHADTWECSYIACPKRKGLTAAPCSTTTPTTKDE